MLIPTRPVPGAKISELVGASSKISMFKPAWAGGMTVQFVVVGVHPGSSVCPGKYGRAATTCGTATIKNKPRSKAGIR